MRRAGPRPGRGGLALALLLAAAGAIHAQTGADPSALPGLSMGTPADAAPPGTGIAQILTVDQVRLYEGSQFGKRVATEIEAASRALAAENRALEAEAAAEERDLTARRPTLPPAEFRVLADAFDARVVDLRNRQAAKLRDLARLSEAEQQRYFAAVGPTLRSLMRQSGAVAILDIRSVLSSVEGIDITDEAILLIDAAIGDGGPAPRPPPGAGPDAAPAPEAPLPQGATPLDSVPEAPVSEAEDPGAQSPGTPPGAPTSPATPAPVP